MTHAQGPRCLQNMKKCGWQSATQTPYDNDVRVRPLTNRLTTAANAQPRGPAGDDVQTVDTLDKGQQKLAQPTSETFPELSNLPGSGTNNGDRYASPTSDDGIKYHPTQTMAAWATTRMRKVYISQNTEIVVHKITHCTRNEIIKNS